MPLVSQLVRWSELLIVSGEKDHTVPRAVAVAAFDRQKQNSSLTEFLEIEGRGHALTIDHGWLEVANVALNFIGRFEGRHGS